MALGSFPRSYEAGVPQTWSSQRGVLRYRQNQLFGKESGQLLLPQDISELPVEAIPGSRKRGGVAPRRDVDTGVLSLKYEGLPLLNVRKASTPQTTRSGKTTHKCTACRPLGGLSLIPHPRTPSCKPPRYNCFPRNAAFLCSKACHVRRHAIWRTQRLRHRLFVPCLLPRKFERSGHLEAA